MSTNTSGVALITGASQGIGAAIARRLTTAGYAVGINYKVNRVAAERLVDELQQRGGAAMAVQADVAQPDEVQQLFHAVEQAFGNIDVLINNAGILTTTPLADTSDALFEQLFSTNTRGVFNTLREATSRLNQGGRIINMSSTSLALNLPGYALYNATKAAVEAFIPILSKELKGRQITVNGIAPGPIATTLFLHGKTDQQIRHFADMSPLERLGQPDDIADIVAFLVSPAGRWVNGQVLRANGGLI